jgi:hypothetical protein
MREGRLVAALALVLCAVGLLSQLPATAAPAPEAYRGLQASFESLQRQLPGLVASWIKEQGLVGVEGVDVKIKLARRIGPTEAKITFRCTITGPPYVPLADSYLITVYFRYYEGHWSTTDVRCPPKLSECVDLLLLAIDVSSDK